jgi:hypothetical protein
VVSLERIFDQALNKGVCLTKEETRLIKIMRRTHKTLIIIALSILVIGLLPGVALVWAETNSNLARIAPNPEALRPAAQGGEKSARSSTSFDDIIVQFGEDSGKISPQSDGSGVEIVPGAAFVHTGELGTGSEANDWFFDFYPGGFLQGDSAVNDVCLAAPVYLPVGSTINSFTVYAFDNFGPSNLIIYLDRTGSKTGAWVELAAVQSINGGSIQILTDPSITSTGGANVVADFYNYHVDFCFPANSFNNLRVYGARVNYTPVGAPGINNVYLPVVLKTEPVIPPTKLYISNNTGGSLTYTVFGTPQGNKSCNIPNGAQNQLCATFTAGTYNWQVVTICNPPTASGTKEYPPGDKILSPFFCR